MKCPYCGVDDGPIERACRCPKGVDKMLLREVVTKSNRGVLLSINYYCPITKKEYKADKKKAAFYRVNTITQSDISSFSVECEGCSNDHELLLTEW
jgi:hypothetical protein